MLFPSVTQVIAWTPLETKPLLPILQSEDVISESELFAQPSTQ